MPSNPESPRRETRALLRAHLSAALRYGHMTRHCAVCHRLQRWEPGPAERDAEPRPPRAVPAGAVGTGAARPAASPAVGRGERDDGRGGPGGAPEGGGRNRAGVAD